ncbi:MAG: MGMT family protein [Gammaproteobacteria bacterium]|nr:MGMT family protein [Gammaproteobacteria bacterium]
MSGSDQKVWKTVACIPRGRVATYGQIADLSGLGRAARQVGRALRNAPSDSEIPWHRVINSAGRISLPKDSPAFNEQRSRLLEEGVVVKRQRVDLATYQWCPGLEELLWQLEG